MSASPDDKPVGTIDGAVDGSVDARRRRARRTALVMGAIALLVYGGFILSGVLSK